MPSRTLIVPLAGPRQDPERVSEAVLPLARALARSSDVVVLISVLELPLSPAETAGTVDEVWYRELQAYLDAVAQTFDAPVVRTVVRQNTSISTEVAQLCDGHDAPLVVMATEGRKGLRRAIRGSVAVEVIQAVTCPVMIVPAAYAGQQPLTEGRLHEVLVPLDGSPLAEAALITGLRCLNTTHVGVHVMKATDETGDEEAIRIYLQSIVDDLNDQGYRGSWSVRYGKPADEIIATARERGNELIAMATRGRRGLDRLVHGSVAEDVVRDAGIPVLVVRGTPSAIAAADERQALRQGYRSIEERAAAFRAICVGDVMSSPPITAIENTPVIDVARIMMAHRIGCVVIVDTSGNVAGIITQLDFAGQAEEVVFAGESESAEGNAATVVALESTGALIAADISTRPVVTITEEEPISRVVELMAEHDIGHIPVVRGRTPVGVVSQLDLLRIVTRQRRS